MNSLFRSTSRALLLIVLIFGGTMSAFAQSSATDDVRALLKAQQEAWNRGDLSEFMAGYRDDSQTRFASGGNLREGWQQALDAYKKGYPDAAAMGRLDFDVLEVRQLAPDAVYVFGRWSVTSENHAQPATGLFTLIVERKDGVWRVTRDHTSAAQ